MRPRNHPADNDRAHRPTAPSHPSRLRPAFVRTAFVRAAWIGAAWIGTALLALAASSPARAVAQPPDTIEYGFTDELVEGDIYNPLGELLRIRTRAQRTSLIRPREHFVNELNKSIENL